jgi:hypothetical protein
MESIDWQRQMIDQDHWLTKANNLWRPLIDEDEDIDDGHWLTRADNWPRLLTNED